MRTLSFLAIGLMFGAMALAQKPEDIHIIRDYKNSLMLVDDNQTMNMYSFSDYGKQLAVKDKIKKTFNYLYSGQEYDSELQVYLFNSRLYTPEQVRFSAPDPASQYFSPYSYVGGDPVNNIDIDGNLGKPLILYQADYNMPEAMPMEVAAIRNEMPDAYYVPMNDFVNGDIQPMHEWNGNAFIYGKTYNVDGVEGRIGLEESSDPRNLRVAPREGVSRNVTNGRFRTEMRGEDFGRRMRQVANDLDLDMSNLVVGTENSDAVAMDIGRGYSERVPGAPRRWRTLKTSGVQKDVQVHYFNDKKGTYLGRYKNGMKEGRVYFEDPDIDSRVVRYIPQGAGGDYINATGGEYMYDLHGVDYSGRLRPIEYANPDGIRTMANGRVPTGLEGKFYSFDFMY